MVKDYLKTFTNGFDDSLPERRELKNWPFVGHDEITGEVVFTEVINSSDHAYVDLGLSVKWATCNVGATKPEEYGDYFAWGETEPKTSVSTTTYTDNPITLPLSADAARVNWGGNWRMPTRAEFDELREQCNWTWTTQNGVYGYKVTSKKSGYTNKSIFLPAAGCLTDSSLVLAGSNGYYWSSSLSTHDTRAADYLYFHATSVGWYAHRSNGHSVRPVCL